MKLPNGAPLQKDINVFRWFRANIIGCAGLAATTACAHSMTLSGVVFDENLELTSFVPGPPSQAVVGVLADSSFAIVGWEGQVRISHDDGALTEREWTIPSSEHLKGFSANGDYTVTMDEQHVTWRQTLNGEFVGQLGAAQLDTAPANLLVRNIGVLTTSGPLGAEQIFGSSGTLLRGQGSIIDFSMDESMFSRVILDSNDDNIAYTEVYRSNGAQVQVFDWLSSAWIGDADLAVLGPQGYCEWTLLAGKICPQNDVPSLAQVSRDTHDGSVLLWSRFDGIVVRYVRSNGDDRVTASVPVSHSITDVGVVGHSIFVATEPSVFGSFED